jgi:hypothetical protein
VVDRRVAGAVVPPDAEGDVRWISSATFGQRLHQPACAVQREVGADGGVAARDVEADADDRHLARGTRRRRRSA